ncbi:MAG: hypothetical protein JWN08_3048 [Frankiales bacterium]|nr:hypothetical protein [Frankiales bacterium]
MPDWLLWLLPVPLATAAAVAWAAWTSRTRGPGSPEESVQQHERFRQAMAAPVRPPGERRRR